MPAPGGPLANGADGGIAPAPGWGWPSPGRWYCWCMSMLAMPAFICFIWCSCRRDSRYSMFLRPSLIFMSMLWRTEGLEVDWRMTLAAVSRAFSRSILEMMERVTSSSLILTGHGATAGGAGFEEGGVVEAGLGWSEKEARR